ncbi:hypothetical protein BBP40_010633 [Aspergillus hancockii]|nr:hypothetical protein BBP40_010633 [Aspergillus hancockii]
MEAAGPGTTLASPYIGPLPKGSRKAFEVGKAPYDYITGMPHDAWRQLLPYWIDTYKKGKASISEELVVGWYRPNPAATCNSDGTSGNTAQQLQIEFDPAEVAQDIIVFSAVLTSDATISVTVGGVALPAQWENKPSGGVGVYHGSVAYGGHRGAVKIAISRAGQTLASFTGTEITTSCPDGYTNWNAWVGSATGVDEQLAVRREYSHQPLAQRHPQEAWSSIVSKRPTYSHTYKSVPEGSTTLGTTGETIKIDLSFSANSTASKFAIAVRASSDSNEQTLVGYDFVNEQLFIDCTKSGDVSFDSTFASVYRGPLTPNAMNKVKLNIFVDQSSVEVFGGQGETTLTAQIFPTSDAPYAKLVSTGGSTHGVEVNIYNLSSTWN